MSAEYTFDVYHAMASLSVLYPEGDFWDPADSSHFLKVATIIATSPEEVFFLSNHHEEESPWTASLKVIWCRSRELRSTSVGDVIHCPTDNRVWLISRDEFKPIPRVFAVDANGIRVLCEKYDKDYVLRFLLKRTAKRCWELLNRSGKWSGTLYEKEGVIKFPGDLVDEEYLFSLSTQFVEGRARFMWGGDEEDGS